MVQRVRYVRRRKILAPDHDSGKLILRWRDFERDPRTLDKNPVVASASTEDLTLFKNTGGFEGLSEGDRVWLAYDEPLGVHREDDPQPTHQYELQGVFDTEEEAQKVKLGYKTSRMPNWDLEP